MAAKKKTSGSSGGSSSKAPAHKPEKRDSADPEHKGREEHTTIESAQGEDVTAGGKNSISGKPASGNTAVGELSSTPHTSGSADPLQGRFVLVTKGPHEGRYAAYQRPTELDKDGNPVKALIRTRDEDDALLVVDYDALAPSVPGRR